MHIKGVKEKRNGDIVVTSSFCVSLHLVALYPCGAWYSHAHHQYHYHFHLVSYNLSRKSVLTITDFRPHKEIKTEF